MFKRIFLSYLQKLSVNTSKEKKKQNAKRFYPLMLDVLIFNYSNVFCNIGNRENLQ